ncbi:MAG: molybdenum cofactor guanylyltransferase [Spirochaetes bacterium]|nr:MAG: molybdenum cofactor guanylyltransferase [Spirochaetota bacterium]
MDQRIEGVTAYIVAGGKSSRFGRDKSLYPYEGKPLIEHVIGTLSLVFDRIVIVADESAKFAYLGLECIPDAVPAHGPIGGIYSALLHAAGPYSFISACDMPFLSAGLIRYMGTFIGTHDVIVPCVNEFYEPLHAFYSRACIDPLCSAIEENRRQIIRIFPAVNVRRIPEDEIRRFTDPSHVFHNINFIEDIAGPPGGMPA